MRVILAETAGFCYGVERAVRLAEQTAREKGSCVMLGSIIHNDKVVGQLEALGARQVQSVEDVHPGDTVLLRAHGERAEVIRALEAKGVGVIDAACPHVLRIHRLVEQAEKQGRTPLIIGEAHHPEVVAAAPAAWWRRTRRSCPNGWTATLRGAIWACRSSRRPPVFARCGMSA